MTSNWVVRRWRVAAKTRAEQVLLLLMIAMGIIATVATVLVWLGGGRTLVHLVTALMLATLVCLALLTGIRRVDDPNRP